MPGGVRLPYALSLLQGFFINNLLTMLGGLGRFPPAFSFGAPLLHSAMPIQLKVYAFPFRTTLPTPQRFAVSIRPSPSLSVFYALPPRASSDNAEDTSLPFSSWPPPGVP